LETIFDYVPLSHLRTIYKMTPPLPNKMGEYNRYVQRLTGYKLALNTALWQAEKQRADELQQQLSNLQGEL
jgi:hypothetical protein